MVILYLFTLAGANLPRTRRLREKMQVPDPRILCLLGATAYVCGKNKKSLVFLFFNTVWSHGLYSLKKVFVVMMKIYGNISYVDMVM